MAITPTSPGNPTSIQKCEHKNLDHLFHPLCKDFDTIKKVGTIAFIILFNITTLCIPLVIYGIYKAVTYLANGRSKTPRNTLNPQDVVKNNITNLLNAQKIDKAIEAIFKLPKGDLKDTFLIQLLKEASKENDIDDNQIAIVFLEIVTQISDPVKKDRYLEVLIHDYGLKNNYYTDLVTIIDQLSDQKKKQNLLKELINNEKMPTRTRFDAANKLSDPLQKQNALITLIDTSIHNKIVCQIFSDNIIYAIKQLSINNEEKDALLIKIIEKVDDYEKFKIIKELNNSTTKTETLKSIFKKDDYDPKYDITLITKAIDGLSESEQNDCLSPLIDNMIQVSLTKRTTAIEIAIMLKNPEHKTTNLKKIIKKSIEVSTTSIEENHKPPKEFYIATRAAKELPNETLKNTWLIEIAKSAIAANELYDADLATKLLPDSEDKNNLTDEIFNKKKAS